MYLHIQKKPNGDKYLTIAEKYHVPGVGARERTVETIGYLSSFKDQYDDPIAHFKQRAKELTEAKKAEQNNMIETLTLDMSSTMSIGTSDIKNVGYGIFKYLYKELELDKFWNWKTRGRKMQYSVDQIFRLLVFSRALNPGSKRYTLQTKDFFFESFQGFSLDDIYHSLDIIALHQEALQQWIYEHSRNICDRDLSITYFDCTNYYFDISRPDVDNYDEEGNPIDENGKIIAAKYRKRGPEKNHRPDPIVGMGLLLDRNGIPLAYDLFPGNESEKVHMRPIINRVKTDFEDCRTIHVADRGLNTSDNIYWLNGDNKGEDNLRDGYVYGQSVRGADAEFKEWVLNQKDYQSETVIDHDGHKVSFTHKSRIYPKTLHVNVTKPGRKTPVKKSVSVDQKQMVYYSEKYAKKQRANRQAMIERAKDLIAHPKKYDKVTSKGSSAYVKNLAFDRQTGEIVDGQKLYLDEEKILEEEKYDGYYSIVTSELSLSDRQIREIYRGLARIEDSFKVTKTLFESRPIYVWLNEHIEAHFATCFVSLILTRLLEHKLGHQFPTGQILDALKRYNCVHLGTNKWQFVYFDEVMEACGKAFDLDLDRKYRTQQEIQRLLRY